VLGRSLCNTCMYSGPGSSVGIATSYGLDGLGIKSRWGRDFPHLSRMALGPTQPPVQWGVFPRGRKRPGSGADHPPLSSAEVKKQSSAIPLLSLRAFVACKKGETYLLVYIGCTFQYTRTCEVCGNKTWGEKMYSI
jgi:hypothetical protein